MYGRTLVTYDLMAPPRLACPRLWMLETVGLGVGKRFSDNTSPPSEYIHIRGQRLDRTWRCDITSAVCFCDLRCTVLEGPSQPHAYRAHVRHPRTILMVSHARATSAPCMQGPQGGGTVKGGMVDGAVGRSENHPRVRHAHTNHSSMVGSSPFSNSEGGRE